MSAKPAKSRLSAGEEVLLVLRTHPKVLVPQGFMVLVLIAALVAAAKFIPGDLGEGWALKAAFIILGYLTLHYCLFPFLKWRSTTYTLTTKQILVARGLLYRNTHSTQLTRVSDIQTERGILDRIFGCGTLVIDNAASGTSGFTAADSNRVILKDVPHALDVEQQIKDLLHTPAP